MHTEISSSITNTITTLIAIGITVSTLRTFLNFSKTSKVVYLATFVGYFCSIVLLFLIPVDIGVTSFMNCEAIANNESLRNMTDFEKYYETEEEIQLYGANTTQCKKPFNYIPPEILYVIWAVLYWVTYVATWVLYPLMQSYVLSGEFTVFGRIKAALKENLVFAIIAVGVVGIIVLILYLAYGKIEDRLIDSAITAGSMWGIFVLISLLGYGLIFIPRKYWRKADRERALQHTQSRLATHYDEVEDNGFTLDQTLKLIKRYDQEMSEDDPNRKYLNEILRHAPEEYGSVINGEGEVKDTYSDLVDLNAKLQWDLHQFNTSRVLFEETFKQAVKLDDVIHARQGEWTKKIEYTLQEPNNTFMAPFWSRLDWFWSLISPVIYRIISIMFGFMSLSLIYSEVIFFQFPKYSFYAFIVSKFSQDPLLLQGMCFLMVSYLGLCTYSALFKLKLFWFYRLLPHQQTDENSILFSAAFMARLIAPLYLNFLHVIDFIAVDEKKKKELPVPSPFVSFLKSDPIREAVYQYFPIILVVFVIFTLFNLGNRIMKLCGLNQVCCTDDFDDDQIERGAEIMFRECEAKQRGTSTIRRIAGAAKGKYSARNTPLPKERDVRSSRSDRSKEPKKEPLSVNIQLDDEEDLASEIVDLPPRPTALQQAFSWFGAFVSPSHSTINATEPPSPPSSKERDRRASREESPHRFPGRERKIDFDEVPLQPLPKSSNPFNPFDDVKPKRVKKYPWEDSDSD